MLRERSSKDFYTVSELNGYIKNIFDSDRVLSLLTVKGEISNFVHHRSGHLYFSLKDSDGQVRAVMFRTYAERLKFRPENGMKVTVRCSVTVFVRDGSYQLYVNSMSPDGIGELYLAYEQLKNKLSSEGLFDPVYKKALPEFPMSVGVITSPTGAAVRDIINVIKRRFPIAKIYLYPSLVQGEGAPQSLIKALDYFNSSNLADVIIIGRGGGSIEDLWAFNNEALARRIFECRIPVISAVGHETDFTICDFVSDMRAPTPSAAAEIAVPDIRELTTRIINIERRTENALKHIAERRREALNILKQSPIFKDAEAFTKPYRERLSEIKRNLGISCEKLLTEKRFSLSVCAEKINALSPLSVLARGYSIAQKDGKALRSVKNVKPDDEIKITLSDGKITAKVLSLEKIK